MGSTETQNVQRGIIMLLFFQFTFLMIFVCIRLIKKKIDVDEVLQPRISKKYEDQQRPNSVQSDVHKASQSGFDHDFDKAAVRRSQIKEDATCIQKWLHSFQEFGYYYCPILMLLPLNILTGTSKSFSLVLFFMISICISLFNMAKIHRNIAQSKCLWVFFENIWLFLSLFFCINQWGATPISMPYIVV